MRGPLCLTFVVDMERLEFRSLRNRIVDVQSGGMCVEYFGLTL